MDEMERLADLGTALRPADVPSDRLRGRTAAAMAAAGDSPAARPRWVRPSLVAASVAAVTAGAVLLTGPTGPSNPTHPDRAGPAAIQPASYTVRVNSDGSVTFTVHNMIDLSGATQALADAGITGRVLTSTQDCTSGPDHNGQLDPAALYPPDTVHRKYRDLGRSGTVTIRSSDYPPGGGLLLAVGGGTDKVGMFHFSAVSFAYADADKIPTCINFVDPGTGGFPSWPPK